MQSNLTKVSLAFLNPSALQREVRKEESGIDHIRYKAMLYCDDCDNALQACNGSIQADPDDPWGLDVHDGIKISKVIVKAKSCDLCATIVRRLEEDNLLNLNDGIIYRISIHNSHLGIQVCPETPRICEPGHLDYAAKGRLRVILELQPYCGHDSTRSCIALESPFRLRGTGRLLGARAHLPLLSQWINSCRDTHGKTCSDPSLPSIQKLQSLFVIDVETMSLVKAPLECRYVALSYCWGKVSVVKNLKSNSAALRVENAFRKIRLPRTIADAIAVVRGVGGRYLWVDALCIVQDDPVSQQVQLAQMCLIYSAAAFTITAAAGDNAESELPGIRSRPQVQEIFQNGSKQFISVIDGPYYGGVQKSEWIQWVWTM